MVARLDAIEESIELLKVAYERYFNGVDRIPPAREHEKVKRTVRELARLRLKTTALRFRANTLRARLVTYEQYWTRILKQIENGTFRRLLAESGRREVLMRQRRAERAQGLARGEDPDAPQPRPAEPSEPIEGSTPANAQRRPLRKPPPRVQLPDGMKANEARDLFKQFVAAKKSAGQAVEGLTYKKLVSKLAREVPKLRQKHGGDIRFEVTTVDGRVRLRARRSGGARS